MKVMLPIEGMPENCWQCPGCAGGRRDHRARINGVKKID